MTVRERIFATCYDRVLAPAERGWLGERRGQVAGAAERAVLEIGAGTGANLEHYRRAARVVAAEPSAAMRARMAPKVPGASVPVTVVDAGADELPYADGSFDTVVSTLVLCSVPDLPAALAEIRRVLASGGALRFLEHVRGDGSLVRWQDRLQPLWTWVNIGCHPNRDTLAAIEAAGFEVEHVERFRSPEPVPLVKPHVQGVARKR